MRKKRRICFWCGGQFPDITDDHVVPRSLGGGYFKNIVRACLGCNQDRGKLVGYYFKIVKAMESGCTKGVLKYLV